MRTWNRKASSIFLGLAMAVGGISLMAWGDAYASVIQAHDPAKIFAASCATCHGGLGNGGVTWVRDADEALGEREAPDISNVDFNRDGVIDNVDVKYIKMKVRNGSNNGAMPAFGKEEITDIELGKLADAIIAFTSDVLGDDDLVPDNPGSLVRLDILDADPWYWERDGVDGNSDDRRVVLTTGQTLKVVNTGRTWHTLTDKANGKDSGFIGYAGNHHNRPGDLDQTVAAGIGYYYAEQGTDLTSGCERYLCKMHPYMQVEVCTGGSLPQPSTQYAAVLAGGSIGLTRAHKHPLPAPATGVGEVWVSTQSQENFGEELATTALDSSNNRSVIGMDGTYQVIDASDWSVSYVMDGTGTTIANVGNNPHNSWPGTDSAGNDVVLSANWHDNTISLMDATNKKILMERRSGSTNAHVITMPTGLHGVPGRFFISHMGGRAIQEINADDLRLGNDPNIPGRLIRGNTGPHGLWPCGDGEHILTADTFGGSATWYNIDTKKRSTASSGGAAPLAPAIFSATGSSSCITGFTNNALSTDVSVYRISGNNIDNVANEMPPAWVAAGTLFKNRAKNIDLKVLPTDIVPITTDNNYVDMAVNPFVLPVESINQARWAHLPIQTPVSPADSGDRHGRYIVTANKASFNVSVTKLNSTTGMPTDTYTFPAGLGAHGVTYGRKGTCTNGTYGNCYYAYVTNTLEDYVSVYDLEMIEVVGTIGGDALWGTLDDGPGMGPAGSALIAETVYVEGGAVEAVINLDPVTAGLCDVIEVTFAVPGPLGACGPPSTVTTGPTTSTALGTVKLATFSGYDICLTDGNPGPLDVLDCGVGAMDGASISAGGTLGVGAVFVSNLPIGVLCPDCRSGVHVGDIPLKLTTGEALGAGATASLTTDLTNDLGITDSLTTNDGAIAKYTYLKEEVWVDTDTVACVVATLNGLVGVINDCTTAGTSGAFGGNSAGVAPAGTINTQLLLDLDLGINTGGQGIVAR